MVSIIINNLFVINYSLIFDLNLFLLLSICLLFSFDNIKYIQLTYLILLILSINKTINIKEINLVLLIFITIKYKINNALFSNL